MIDYIWNRIHGIRNEKVLDFFDKFKYVEGLNMKHLEGNSSIIQFHAKEEKNMKSSEDKQTTYRNKTGDK